MIIIIFGFGGWARPREVSSVVLPRRRAPIGLYSDSDTARGGLVPQPIVTVYNLGI